MASLPLAVLQIKLRRKARSGALGRPRRPHPGARHHPAKAQDPAGGNPYTKGYCKGRRCSKFDPKFDPKGDADLMKRVVAFGLAGGPGKRPLHLSFRSPEFSARYNPVGTTWRNRGGDPDRQPVAQ